MTRKCYWHIESLPPQAGLGPLGHRTVVPAAARRGRRRTWMTPNSQSVAGQQNGPSSVPGRRPEAKPTARVTARITIAKMVPSPAPDPRATVRQVRSHPARRAAPQRGPCRPAAAGASTGCTAACAGLAAGAAAGTQIRVSGPGPMRAPTAARAHSQSPAGASNSGNGGRPAGVPVAD